MAENGGGDVCEVEEEPEPYPPWNFSWVVEDELAVMAWPQNTLNLDYLYNVGIRHLVTLSPEKLPPVEGYSKIEWTLIAVDEFEDPTIKQILKFIDICQKSLERNQESSGSIVRAEEFIAGLKYGTTNKILPDFEILPCEAQQAATFTSQPVGVHCRMGRGRSGVMAACYLVRFKDLAPETAMAEVRLIRPNSIETPEQERAVKRYFDCVRGTTPVESADDDTQQNEQ